MPNALKKIAAIGIAMGLILASPVLADDATDDTGPLFGTTTPGAGGSYTTRETSGRKTGTIEAAPTGGFVVRDTSGKRTGTIEQGFSGEMILRDTRGRRTGTIGN